MAYVVIQMKSNAFNYYSLHNTSANLETSTFQFYNNRYSILHQIKHWLSILLAFNDSLYPFTILNYLAKYTNIACKPIAINS